MNIENKKVTQWIVCYIFVYITFIGSQIGYFSFFLKFLKIVNSSAIKNN